MTDEQIRQHHNNIDENIRKFGYNSTFVFTDDGPSFCYSTGVYRNFAIPEIFISSLPKNLSHELIENYVNKFKNRKCIPLNEKMHDITDRFPIYLIEVSKEKLAEYTLSSARFYGNEKFEYVQLIYPDAKGYFPNDIGYDYDQMIMGEFEN
ncbi:DUF4262 domain-containing protein [Hymenobacter rubripertinctus]|uniref:DUF4262 domain-containing protein n=1 Tax=Hymenobacter rubripertinctus TaxID=2029981 RepID=A0A418QRA6_9BACT|nr:DUF4262 domain-containing protein [Hymenobacter rubripertinctus]RIY07618.1 DUF4262 domain-containing protein [Hymenobacter rubripertinctus]